MGIIITHLMFKNKVFEFSSINRSEYNFLISEVIASFGLIAVIALSGKKHVEFAPLSIAAYITSAYWFTSSTSFANPAVTFARMFTNTFSGIDPGSVLPFMGAQLVGAIVAYFALKNLKP